MRRLREQIAAARSTIPDPNEEIGAARSVPVAAPGPADLGLPELAPSAASQTGPPSPSGPGDCYRVSDFLDHHDESFVRHAYRGLLGRDPDPTGWAHFLDALRAGTLTKIEILGRLRYSKEGRRRARPVAGLLPRYLATLVWRIPVVGYAVRLPVAILRLPRNAGQAAALEAFFNHRLRETEDRIDGALERIESGLNAHATGLEKLGREAAGRTRVEDLARELGALRDAKADGAAVRALEDGLDGLQNELARRVHTSVFERELASLRDAKAGVAAVESLAGRLEVLAASLLGKAEERDLRAAAETLGRLARRLDKIAWRKADADRLQDLVGRFDGFAEQQDATLGELESRLGSELALLREHEQSSRARLEGTLREEVGAVRASSEESRAQLEARITTELAALRELGEQSRAQLAEQVESGLAALREADGRGEEDRAELGRWLSRIEQQMQGYRMGLIEEQRRVALLLEEARKRFPKPLEPAQLESMLVEEEHQRDALYASLEDSIRGPYSEIRERLGVYVPYVEAARTATRNAPIVDLGCGRGEWLDLMARGSWPARGVDHNRVLVRRCLEAGFDAEEADAVEYLRRQKANSFSAVTAFHVLEHLPLGRRVALLDEAMRTLKPGGVAIFETPNPENVVVGACNFYADPDHVNPLYPPTTKFLLEERGFVRVEVLRPNEQADPEWMQPLPSDDPLSGRINSIVTALHDWFNVSPDFTVLGWKA